MRAHWVAFHVRYGTIHMQQCVGRNAALSPTTSLARLIRPTATQHSYPPVASHRQSKLAATSRRVLPLRLQRGDTCDHCHGSRACDWSRRVARFTSFQPDSASPRGLFCRLDTVTCILSARICRCDFRLLRLEDPPSTALSTFDRRSRRDT